jgi:hypothetical protein
VVELGSSYQNNRTLFTGRQSQPNNDGVTTSFRQQTLRVGVTPRPDLELNLLLPYTLLKHHEPGKDLKLQGLGDVSLYARWRPWRGRLAVIAGLSLPTGESAAGFVPGVTPPSLLQLGSGSYDPLLGFEYQVTKGPVILMHQTSMRLSGGTSPAGLKAGPIGHSFTRVGADRSSWFMPSLGLEAVFRGRDQLDGTSIANTGASFWFLVPEVAVRVSPGVRIFARANLPLYRNVVQTQLVPGELWSFGIIWSY